MGDFLLILLKRNFGSKLRRCMASSLQNLAATSGGISRRKLLDELCVVDMVHVSSWVSMRKVKGADSVEERGNVGLQGIEEDRVTLFTGYGGA